MSAPTLILLLAVWIEGALALALLYVLGQRRLPRIARGEINIRDIAVTSDGWPLDAQLASNAFSNQFQLPVLFYVAAGLSLYLGVGWVEAALAVVFVASRIVHAVIHVTSNHVVQRFGAYVTGYGVLMLFWLLLLVRLVLEAF